MGYFKTLTIDPSAAREYSRRWAQSDQAGDCRSYLVSGHGMFRNMTTATIAQPVNQVRSTQSDQVEGGIDSHPVSSHRSTRPLTRTTIAQPVNLTREHVGRALHSWRKNAEHNPRDLNALNRASLNLEACPWYLMPDGELVITSASDSRKRYHVNLDGCDCRAALSGRPCWHVAAYKVLHTADAMRRLEAS